MLTLFQRFTGSPRRVALFESWAPLVIITLAAALRLYNLAYPHELVFDETYYVKDAYSLLQSGYERDWSDSADSSFNSGAPSGLLAGPSFIVHPPLGKWLIGLGMLVFGPGNPFGWRIVVALFGIGAVWFTMKSAKLVFRSTIWASVAGLFMAIDGVGIVLSRTALLDQILGFFVILAFFFLLKDKAQLRLNSWNRPWLFLMAISLGLASVVKWSGVYFLFGFLLYIVLAEAHLNFRVQKKIESKAETELPKSFWLLPSVYQALRNAILVVIPAFVIYLVSWTGWLLSKNAWSRNWAEEPGHAFTGLFAWIPTSLQSLWHYHTEIYTFHINLHASHPYAANPITWPFMLRPTSFFWDEQKGTCLFGSPTSKCASAITALGNPIIWWAAVLAIGVLAASWFRTRDKTTTLMALGLFAGYVPWLMLQNRTVFEFYAVAFSPWIILFLVAGLREWFRNSPKPIRSANWITGFIGLAVLSSAFFYPIWSGIWIGYDFWHLMMWLPSWI